MSAPDQEERLRDELTEGIRSQREHERGESRGARTERPSGVEPARTHPPLGPIPSGPRSADEALAPPPESPAREALNARWDVGAAMAEPPAGRFGRLLSVFRGPLQKLVRFALGPVVERQVEMNSSQVQFDNEIVRYLDERMDRVSRHYDAILGLHGKRMEEIDERHLILQQELIRHVHDLVQRIEFVFESAEQNHLYLEGMLRETKQELSRLIERLEQLERLGPEK